MAARSFRICKMICFNKEKIASLKNRLPGDNELKSSAGRHKALGHPRRLAILHVLSMDECCVCDLANILDKPVSTVSQHLRTLAAEGFLHSRQEGKLVFYSLTANARTAVRASSWKIVGRELEE